MGNRKLRAERQERRNKRRDKSTPEQKDQKLIRPIAARTSGQRELINAIENNQIVLSTGPAGTGKTYLAIAKAVEALKAQSISKIILSRPAIEAGETLGHLPGTFEEKLDPYLRPLYDALLDRLGSKSLKSLRELGVIEIAPVAYLRGRTFSNAFVVIDEAQNCTFEQLKMILTRIGFGTSMVINGDPEQIDISTSGLSKMCSKLKDVPGVKTIELSKTDIVRSPLITKLLDAMAA